MQAIGDGANPVLVKRGIDLAGALEDLQVSGDYAIGAGIVRRSLSEPAHLIAANAGYPGHRDRDEDHCYGCGRWV